MWTEWLEKWTPLSGRVIKEDGNLENVADLMKRQDLTTNALSVRDGKVYQSFFRGVITAGQTLYFIQNVQPNKTIRGISFASTFTGGIVEYIQRVNSTKGNILEALPNYNADRRKINDLDFSSTSIFERVDNLTNGIIIDKGYGLTASTGAGRGTASLSGVGIGGIYDADSKPSFEITNTSGQDVEVAFVWIWEEV